MDGGYYRFDATDKITVLALNTLYYDYESVPEYVPGAGARQLEWLEEQL